MKIRCYGGPAHGMMIDQSVGNRFDYHSRDFYRQRPFDLYDPADTFAQPDLEYDRVTYYVNWYHERRGNMGRRMPIALLEGTKLTHNEDWDLVQEMGYLPWEPVRVPDFMKEFDRWWNVTLYKLIRDSGLIKEELRMP